MRRAFTRSAAIVLSAAALLVAAAPAAQAQGAGWQPGPDAAQDNTYNGFIDVPRSGDTVPGSGSFTVSGWFVDTTAQGWAGADDVQVWLGTMDSGQMLARAAFAQSRPDVAAATGNPFWDASGFAAAVPGLPSGDQALNVYVHTPGKGWWFKNLTVSGGGSATTAAAPVAAGAPAPAAAPAGGGAGAPQVTVINPTNNQNVSTKGDYTINGSVSDAASIDRIEVWINGERNTKYATLLGTTKPNPDGSWSVTFTPTHFPSTHSNLYIYAHNGANGQETLVSREINIVDR